MFFICHYNNNNTNNKKTRKDCRNSLISGIKRTINGAPIFLLLFRHINPGLRNSFHRLIEFSLSSSQPSLDQYTELLLTNLWSKSNFYFLPKQIFAHQSYWRTETYQTYGWSYLKGVSSLQMMHDSEIAIRNTIANKSIMAQFNFRCPELVFDNFSEFVIKTSVN